MLPVADYDPPCSAARQSEDRRIQMRNVRKRLTYANVMSTIAVFVALGGGAYAAVSSTPGAGGVIHGCYAKRNGALRLVATGRKCSKRERAIAFNQVGPAGSRGLSGPAGAPGKEGTSGKEGAQGKEGAPGSALAFAHVNADGTLDTANSKNVIDVRPSCGGPCSSPPSPGPAAFQCFRLAFTPQSAVASTEKSSIETAARVEIPGDPNVGAGGCAPGYASAEVFTFNTKSGTAALAGFYVVFN
jgi:hypothetical protein